MRNDRRRKPQVQEFLAAIGNGVPREPGPWGENKGSDTSRDEQAALRILETLPERSRRMIKLRYGIGTVISWTLQEIGLEYGLTRERVRQILRASLEKLEKGQIQGESRDHV